MQNLKMYYYRNTYIETETIIFVTETVSKLLVFETETFSKP